MSAALEFNAEAQSCKDAEPKRNRKVEIDLGLALLECRLSPRQRLSIDEIAAWCQVSRSAIWNIERRALRKIRQRLSAEVKSDLHGELSFASLLRGFCHHGEFSREMAA